MFLFGLKSIHSLEAQDLQEILGQQFESGFLDVKSEAYLDPNTKDKDKKNRNWDKVRPEFCKDICSFANANGGWIIYGATENQGVVNSIDGIESNIDAEIKLMTDWIKADIEPTIMGIVFQPIMLTNQKAAIVVFIPPSFLKPHRVKTSKKFPIRRSGSSPEMTIDELRNAFNFSTNLVDQIKQLRTKRVESIYNENEDEIPALLEKRNPACIYLLHTIPLAFEAFPNLVDTSIFKRTQSPYWVSQVRYGDGRHNLEGYIWLSHRRHKYTQLHRNGIVETVEVMDSTLQGDRILGLPSIEELTLSILKDHLTISDNLNIAPPLIVMLSLVGTKGLHLRSGESFIDRDTIKSYRRHNILIPDVVIQNYQDDLRQVLKPIFDILWNAAGFDRSYSYDPNGNWISK